MVNRSAGLEGPGDLQLRLINTVTHHERRIDKRRVHRRQRLGDGGITLRLQIETERPSDVAGPGDQEASIAIGGDGLMHLLAEGGGIDAELTAGGGTVPLQELTIDALH